MRTVTGFLERRAGRHAAHREIEDYLAGQEQERERLAADVEREADRFWDGLLQEAGEVQVG